MRVFGPEVHQYYADLFARWREIDSAFHRKVTLEEKFGDLLEGRCDEVVYSMTLGDPPPASPLYREYVRLVRGQEVKRQRATLLVGNPAFLAAVIALAKRWQLDTHQFDEPVGMWFHETGFQCWDTFLLWLSARYLKQYGESIAAEKRAAATRYLQDLDDIRLRQTLDEITSRMPVVRFRQEARQLARSHGLSGLWDHSIEVLLTSGRLFVPFENARVVLQKDKHAMRLLVEVYPETTKADVAAQWRKLTSLRVRLFPSAPQRQRKRAALDRDFSTQVERRSGRSIGEIVTEDYDLDERFDEFGSWAAVSREENLLAERLRKGASRLTKAQAEALSATAEPLLPEWVKSWEQERGDLGKEWYF